MTSPAGPIKQARLRVLPFLLIAVAVTHSTGCSSKKGDSPGAQSPERQSDAEVDLAMDLMRKGQPRAALDHAQKAVAFNEDNEKAQYIAAGIYLSFCSTNRGLDAPDCNLAQADKYLRASLKANAQFRDAINALGQVLILEKKYKEAITVLEPLTKDAAYAHPYFAWGNLGWAQVQDGQVDAGIVSLKNAVAEPRFCVGYYHLGLAYEKKNDLTGAEDALTSAVSVADPSCENLQDAWEARGKVRLRLGKNAEARQDFEKCRDISIETTTGKACLQKVGPLPAKPPTAPPPTPDASGRKT